MALVLTMAGVLWGIGWAMKAPVRMRAGMIAGLWAGVVLIQLILPEGHPLRAATGGEVRPWLALGLVAGVVLAYRAGVGALRSRAARARVPAQAAPEGPFRPVEVERYARHILLREIGGPGQARLKAARVLVVGAGGLGSPVILYLAAAGVGRIGIIDHDAVEGSNLQRQIAHADARIGMPKVFSAEIAARAINPFVEVVTWNRRLDAGNAADLVAAQDLVIDGTDGFETREIVNAACVAAGVPLISGAITQWEGQVALFDPARGGPCRACVFPARPAPGMVPTCAEAGVAAPLPGVVGSIMAMEAVKHLTGAGRSLRGRMLLLDALEAETRTISLHAREGCPVCGGLGGSRPAGAA
jgi:molybdopterin/thiamine biosynthesis adenylyltransferase